MAAGPTVPPSAPAGVERLPYVPPAALVDAAIEAVQDAAR
jgi:hypothetical protein